MEKIKQEEIEKVSGGYGDPAIDSLIEVILKKLQPLLEALKEFGFKIDEGIKLMKDYVRNNYQTCVNMIMEQFHCSKEEAKAACDYLIQDDANLFWY